VKARRAEISRRTRETDIRLKLNLDGQGRAHLRLKLPFLGHLLEVLLRQALFDLDLFAKGDLEVDYHHLVEDLGLALGEGLSKALGDKAGLTRFGAAEAPLDEALVRAALDLSGRPFLAYGLDLANRRVRDFDVQLVEEFLRAFVDRSRLTLHLVQSSGRNNHHILEAAFKALGLALRQACAIDPRRKGMVASTKGTLSK
jgi:imidazoleglycerol-phosphate dehydratase